MHFHPVADLGQSCIRTKEVGREDGSDHPRVLLLLLPIHSPFLFHSGVVRESIIKEKRMSDIRMEEEELIEIIMQLALLSVSSEVELSHSNNPLFSSPT